MNLQTFNINSLFNQNQASSNVISKQKVDDFNMPNQNFNSELQQKNNEVTSHYRNRKKVYENVLNDLKDHEKAVCYSNIWSNMMYLGVKYPQKIEEAVKKYSPKP